MGQFPHSTRRRYQKRLPKRDPIAQSHRIEVHYTVLTPHNPTHQRVAFIYNRRVSHRRSNQYFNIDNQVFMFLKI
nr:MAG TPA: hypothetical protein [Caudoviricetes sp.]